MGRNIKKYQRQDADFDKRFHKQQEQWDSREKGMNEQYQNRVGHSKKAYETQLKNQHERFDSVYTKTDAANKESLKIQNRNLLKEQVELKKKFFKETERYAGKEEDPFYKLQDRGNRLRENPDFYIIEAYVPDHEKDSIKVIIKDDTASITGKRAFTDEIQEEGRKLSTNSYQSFREDFNFDKPVITEGMTRERKGDYVTFWVPKLNSFEGIRKLSKKA
jgi:HSP20 family molecular chaperone IbpA